jgi:hypothetical protein
MGVDENNLAFSLSPIRVDIQSDPFPDQAAKDASSTLLTFV